jgi:NAD(P)-dependent dehydrogenase (short-subunit alcohol dehydrogenase family)
MARLQGRRVLLTGASRGVGRETVRLFSREGAEIIGVARDGERLAALASEYPSFQGVTGDITDRGLGARLSSIVAERWGALDLLINNAAIQEYNAGFHAEPLDALERNVTTSLYVEEMFSTGFDAANRAVFAEFAPEDAKVVGLALRAEKKLVDKITKGARMHA